ncbi:MAG: phosphoribosylaminoimidazolesuccinocarboxamide synthase [Candidatus Lokiarchaeota archaeon]|nr:phosphoribosylaminoimidazolesuccinocarboxamide synthase [Candidatus Lokiarchaeota archaeon]
MSENIKLGKKLAEGKTKVVYESKKPDAVILEYKDDITAGDGLKHDTFPGKGKLNAAISAKIFEVLNENDVNTHFISFIPPVYMVVKKIDMLPVEVVLRNRAYGHFLQRMPFESGHIFEKPIIEFFYKDDEKHDPMINEDHFELLNLAEYDEVLEIKDLTRKVNVLMKDFFDKKGIDLIDFKIEVGRTDSGEILVGDEINGDSCRLWDQDNPDKIYDKDIYRRGESLEEVKKTYLELYEKVVGKKFEE